MLISFISLLLTVASADMGGATASNQLSALSLLTSINASLTPGQSTVGGATAANQVTGNASLASIDSKLTAPLSVSLSGGLSIGKVDQGLGGTSAWKVDGSAVTQPISGAVSVSNFPATQPVSGTVTANQGGTWNLNNITGSVTLPTGAATSANQATEIGSLSSIDTKLTSPLTVNSSQAGTWNINNVSGTVSLPTGAATASNQTTANTSLSSIDSKLTSPLSVNASQTGTWNLNNISGTVSLPTGAATSSNQTTANTSLSSIDSKLTSPLNVAQSGTWNLNNISGTVSLPTGAATSANQTTANTSLASLVTNTTGIALDATVSGLQVSQGSSTAGQKGSLLQAAVTSSVASYTSGQTSPLTMNARGALRVKETGFGSIFLLRNDYSINNATTSAYLQLTGSTANEVNRLQIFDSSGQDLVLATGSTGSEIDQIAIAPGGYDSPLDLYIASGARISIKAKSSTAIAGVLLITGLK